MLDPRWSRWISASIYKHFRDVTGQLFIEATERNTDTLTDFFELRITGPSHIELTRDEWKLLVEINLLIQSDLREDVFALDRLLGTGLQAFTTTIPIYEFGDNPTILLECLQLISSSSDTVEINRYGQQDANTKIVRASINAHYKVYLNGIPDPQQVAQALAFSDNAVSA